MFKNLLLCGVAMGTALGSLDLHAQAVRSELLVVNQGDRSVSIVDPAAGKVVGTVPVGGTTGHEIAVSPDHRTAFVPIYGDSGVGRPGTDGSSMAVIDLPSRKVRATVDFGHGVRPHRPVYDARRGVLYVTTELDQSISVVNPRTLKIVGSIPTGQPESHMLIVSHDGRRGYTANVGSGTVSVLDMEGRKKIAVIPVAPHVQRISITRDDKFVFTSDQTQPRLAVIDTSTDKFSRWIALPGIGYGATATEDGRYLLVTLREMGKVAVIDLQTMSVVRTLDVGHGPVEILMRPGGRTAYVSCPPDAAVAEIALDGDAKSWRVSRSIPAGTGADGLAWSGN